MLLYNLTDVVNMVELVKTTVKLKRPQTAFPDTITVREPSAPINFDVGCLGGWIEEALSSWNLA